jgi:hypothetical protein
MTPVIRADACKIRIQIYEFLFFFYFLLNFFFFRPRAIESADGDPADKAVLLYIVLAFDVNWCTGWSKIKNKYNRCTDMKHIFVCRIFFSSLTVRNTSFVTRSVQLIFSILLQHHILKHCVYFWSTLQSVQFSSPKVCTRPYRACDQPGLPVCRKLLVCASISCLWCF